MDYKKYNIKPNGKEYVFIKEYYHGYGDKLEMEETYDDEDDDYEWNYHAVGTTLRETNDGSYRVVAPDLCVTSIIYGPMFPKAEAQYLRENWTFFNTESF